MTEARENVRWVRSVLQKLIDNPRLLRNEEFLAGTLRSLVHSLDPESNPKMKALR